MPALGLVERFLSAIQGALISGFSGAIAHGAPARLGSAIPGSRRGEGADRDHVEGRSIGRQLESRADAAVIKRTDRDRA